MLLRHTVARGAGARRAVALFATSKEATMKRRIHIDRDGLTLVGDLFVPDAFDEGGSYPAVVVQGSFSSVKEQMPDSYAARFAAQGFVALSFDYAHYGQSDGQPRQFESPDEKLQDLKAAVTYLLEQPFVSAVGMVGVCTSASNGVYLAAEDARLKGFATIAGFLADAGMFKATYGVDGIARRLDEAAAARRAFEHSGTATTIPVYSETDPSAVNYNATAGAYDYYTNPGRGNVPEYVNAFDVRSWDGWLGLDPLARAAQITVPTIVVHSDGCPAPDQAKRLHAAVQGAKELVWTEGNHFDFYDAPDRMDEAVSHVSRFFRNHLA